MKKVFIIFLLGFFITHSLIAQDQRVGMIKYSPEFMFADGIYLSFTQLKNNDPVPIARVVSANDHNDPDFYTKLLEEKSIIFFDDFGVQQSVSVEKIWGFCRNGIVYIRIASNYSRVTIIGSICHFVANITTYNTQYYDPYSYNPYYYRYSATPPTTASTEMRQFLIDFETGKIMDYDVQGVEVLLMKDPELHDEFEALGNKKQKQMKFLYIRKFNERNPLYIPVNK
jgi:hypothetical protein